MKDSAGSEFCSRSVPAGPVCPFLLFTGGVDASGREGGCFLGHARLSSGLPAAEPLRVKSSRGPSDGQVPEPVSPGLALATP